MNKTPSILAVGLIGLAALAAGPTARAAEVKQSNPSSSTGIVVAQEAAPTLSATPVAPRAIRIQAQPGDQITLSAPGERSRQVRADGTGAAWVTKLTAGTTHTVTTADGSTTVTPLLGAGRARNLQVTATDAIDSVTLTWQHPATAARGDIAYRVEATPVDEGTTAPALVAQVATTTATLEGLDPHLRYSFRVTPFNALGDGKPSIALMTRSLSAMVSRPAQKETAEPVPTAPVAPQTPQEPPQADPAPASAPIRSGPAPAAPPVRPTTRTIYVCPEGFADQGGTCTKTMGYTYQTQDYTYTRGKVGTETFASTCSHSYTAPDGTIQYLVPPHPCTITRDVFGDIKDPTPAGWEDTGSNWRKKDDAPAGWSDDGSQWVQTTEKVAQVVPA